jgi:polysaccharide biosynthesis protein PslH
MPAQLRNLSILAQHAWPPWATRSVPGQRDRVLDWIDSEQPTHLEQLVRLCVIRRWERLYFPLAAEVWAASEADAARQRFLGGGRVRARAIPNALDLSHYPWETGPAVCDDSVRDIVFPANFDYQPNVVGAKVFRDRVFPAVRSRIPDARFVLVGRDRDGSARALADSPQIVVTGEVPDTRPYLRRAGIVVVPLFHGSGTRFKILEALALGVPVVTTELGCAGLNVRDGQHVMIRDITQFADVVTAALTGQLDREALSYAGRQLVEAEHTWTAVSELVRDSLGLAAR